MSILSTGLVFLFWICLCGLALKAVVKMLVPRRVRKLFFKLGRFTLNLVCDQVESCGVAVYKSFTEKLNEKEESIDESVSPSLDAEALKYNKAVAGNKVRMSENVVYPNFKSNRN